MPANEEKVIISKPCCNILQQLRASWSSGYEIRGRWFESQHRILGGHCSHEFVVKLFSLLNLDSIDVLRNQCDHIGRFLKVIAVIFPYKISPKRLLTIGLFWKSKIMKNLPWVLFRQLLEIFGLLFYPNIWSHCPQRLPSY